MSGNHRCTVAVALKPRQHPQGDLVLGEGLSFGFAVGVPATESAWHPDPALGHETIWPSGYFAGSWLSMKL